MNGNEIMVHSHSIILKYTDLLTLTVPVRVCKITSATALSFLCFKNEIVEITIRNTNSFLYI